MDKLERKGEKRREEDHQKNQRREFEPNITYKKGGNFRSGNRLKQVDNRNNKRS